MTSVTAVPLQPIAKGSLVKLWIGVGIVVLAALALAWFGTSAIRTKYETNEQFLARNADNADVKTTSSGLQYQILSNGEGPSPTDADVALIAYTGTLRDGKVFDKNENAPMPIAGVIPGFSEGLKLMQRGGKYRLWIKPDLAYGPEDQTNPQTGQVMMPGNSLLIFDVEMKDFTTRENFQKQIEQMQKERQGQGAPGAEQLPPGAVPVQ